MSKKSQPTYAHFPGQGPQGAHCRDCAHAGMSKAANGRETWWGNQAAAFCQITPSHEVKPSGLGALRPLTPACKYYERRTGEARSAAS